MNARPIFIFAGLGALALWLLSRTERGAVALEGITVTAAKIGSAVANALLPRGIRYNNPGNIDWIPEPSARWRGMYQIAGRVAAFETPAQGVRAIGGELKASIRKGQTIQQAIYEWAPPTENDTASYLGHIEQETGLDRAQKLRLDHLPALAAAITLHENGQQPYDPADIAEWVYS